MGKGSGEASRHERGLMIMTGLTRRLSSIVYYIQKLYWKMITAKPSLFLIAIIAVAASIFFLGGGLYDLLEKPLVAAFAAGGRIIFYYPYGINEQFVAESLFAMIIYAIAVVGLLMTYESTKYAYRPRQAFMLLLIGCTFVFVAYVLIEFLLLAR
ncbi:MAG: hypothetical protein JSV57_05745 [Candidatus Bathyarchaeota archaeon]|nr:MAG: hypothetical protein JSV57_05745 [Candidatus Bathyarchaeota archaeon]